MIEQICMCYALGVLGFCLGYTKGFHESLSRAEDQRDYWKEAYERLLNERSNNQ
jgi:hypothetical protein